MSTCLTKSEGHLKDGVVPSLCTEQLCLTCTPLMSLTISNIGTVCGIMCTFRESDMVEKDIEEESAKIV